MQFLNSAAQLQILMGESADPFDPAFTSPCLIAGRLVGLWNWPAHVSLFDIVSHDTDPLSARLYDGIKTSNEPV